MNPLIERFKNYRKRKHLTTNNEKGYALVGLGMHSIQNILPVINYLRLNLKYIVTKSAENAALIDESYPSSIGTNDFDQVLNDDDISGIFISSNPLSHYELVKKSLKANKHVFVEKPPCTNLKELTDLINIEKSSKGKCLVGLQKQYAPFIKYLKSDLKEVSYNYRFVTGYYPEGDASLDLFIHPLSLVAFLFGEVKKCNMIKSENANSETILLQLAHNNKNIGLLELSTNYSWQNATEKLIINTSNEIYEITDSEELISVPKQGSFLNIPMEKVWQPVNKQVILQKRNNFNPILQNNQLYSSGYISEIETFIDICESRKEANNSSLSSCTEAFKLIDQIKNSHVQ